MKTTTLLLSTTLLFAFSGCCLKSIQIEPQLNNIDLRTATIDSAYAKLKFELKECCPTRKQKATITFLETQTRNLYVQLINNHITLSDYNAKINAAKYAIENVVLHCTQKPIPVVDNSSESNTTRITSSRIHIMTAQEAWENLDMVTQGL
jgi:hypothetical protein